MENVKMTKTGNKLTIEVDLSKKGTPSSTGKSQVIASTKGNQKIDGTEDIYIGLNIYKKL